MTTPPTSLAETQREIAEAVYPALLKIAERFAAKFPHLREEFLSAAGETACRVARRYDPACGAKLEAYGSRRMNGACLDVMRNCGSILGTHRVGKTVNRTPPPVESIHRFDAAEGRRFDIPSDELPVGWEAESEDFVLATTRDLPGKYRDVVRKKLLHAATPTFGALGKEMGLDSTRANQLYLNGADMLAGRPPRYEYAV